MRAVIAVGSFILILIGLWLCWPLFFPVTNHLIGGQLLQVDMAISQGRTDQALALLENFSQNLSARQWLRVEKRLKEIAEKTGLWPKILPLSAMALKQYPGNISLAAFHVWILLKSGRIKEASELGKEKLTATPFSSLATQASIEQEFFLKAKGQPTWEFLKTQLADLDTVSLKLLEKLITFSPDVLLKRNAILSALAQGKMEYASAFLENLPLNERSSPPFDQLQALVTFDLGHWQKALGFLSSLVIKSQKESFNNTSFRWDFFATLLAETYLRLGNIQSAKTIYDQLLQNQKTELVAPAVFLNRSRIALLEKKPDLVFTLLTPQNLNHQDAESDHDAISWQAKMLLWEAAFFQDRNTVEKDLNKVIKAVKENEENDFFLEAVLLKAKLFPGSVSVSYLWNLFHRHQDYAPLAKRLVWQLILNEDYTQVVRALAMFEEKNKSALWWTWYYRGLAACLQNDFSIAKEAFGSIASAQQDYSLFYNWALALAVESRVVQQKSQVLLEQAMEKILLCLDHLPMTEKSAELLAQRSQILTLRGQVGMALLPLYKAKHKIRQQAMTDLTQAVRLSPVNLKAAFLLRQLTFSENTKNYSQDNP